jgi:hypothetical protein
MMNTLGQAAATDRSNPLARNRKLPSNKNDHSAKCMAPAKRDRPIEPNSRKLPSSTSTGTEHRRRKAKQRNKNDHEDQKDHKLASHRKIQCISRCFAFFIVVTNGPSCQKMLYTNPCLLGGSPLLIFGPVQLSTNKKRCQHKKKPERVGVLACYPCLRMGPGQSNDLYVLSFGVRPWKTNAV